MTMNGPEPDDVIGTEDPRASFEDFVEDAADRLLAAAELLTGPAEAQDLLAGVLERARHCWWIARRGPRPGAAGAADAGPRLGPPRPAGARRASAGGRSEGGRALRAGHRVGAGRAGAVGRGEGGRALRAGHRVGAG